MRSPFISRHRVEEHLAFLRDAHADYKDMHETWPDEVDLHYIQGKRDAYRRAVLSGERLLDKPRG